jgi:DNA-binding beta-propeller fold protein YncE
MLSSCTHVAPAVAVERPAWPSAPERARMRWVKSFPDDTAAHKPQVGFWRRVLDVIAGTESEAEGPEGRLLVRPFGLSAAGQQLLVADPDGKKVLRVTWRSGEFEELTCRDSWVAPMAAAFGPDGSVFVADGGRVWRWTKAGCTQLAAGLLKRPTGLVVSQEKLWVVDPPQHLVFALSFEGRELSRIGDKPDAQLNFPTSLAARADGTLVVVDALNYRVVTFSAAGAPTGALGERGDGAGRFGRPKAVAVDSAGRIYVTDVQYDVVVIFGAGGLFELAIGGSGAGPGSLTLPAGVAVSDNMLFVADSYNHRVQVYEILGDEP